MYFFIFIHLYIYTFFNYFFFFSHPIFLFYSNITFTYGLYLFSSPSISVTNFFIYAKFSSTNNYAADNALPICIPIAIISTSGKCINLAFISYNNIFTFISLLTSIKLLVGIFNKCSASSFDIVAFYSYIININK